jgi:hypothetical protein
VSDTPTDPMFDFLTARKRELEATIVEATAGLREIDRTLAALGRTRVRRRLKEVAVPDPPAPFYRGVVTPEPPPEAA